MLQIDVQCSSTSRLAAHTTALRRVMYVCVMVDWQMHVLMAQHVQALFAQLEAMARERSLL